MTDELWSAVDRLRKLPNYVPKVAERDKLLEHISRLQTDLDERIIEYAHKHWHQERQATKEKHDKKVQILNRKIWSLNEKLRQIRLKEQNAKD